MIAEAIVRLRPGARWSLNGETYSGLTWLDTNTVPPTEEEINAEIEMMRAELAATAYQRQRRPEYPGWEVLADALYWQSKGDDSKMAAYVAACDAVKDKYPKIGEDSTEGGE